MTVLHFNHPSTVLHFNHPCCSTSCCCYLFSQHFVLSLLQLKGSYINGYSAYWRCWWWHSGRACWWMTAMDAFLHETTEWMDLILTINYIKQGHQPKNWIFIVDLRAPSQELVLYYMASFMMTTLTTFTTDSLYNKWAPSPELECI